MSFYYLFICLGFFGIADLLAVATKGRISSVFAALIFFLLAFMANVIPANIIDQAGLSQVARWSSAFLIVHMGTMINLKELAREWRTVALSVVAMLVVVGSIWAAVPLVGREAAVVAIPVMKGGIIATQIITQAALDKGLAVAAAFAALVYAIHKFVGTPIASYCGIKEAEELLHEYRTTGKVKGLVITPDGRVSAAADEAAAARPPFYVRAGYANYFTEYSCLATAALFAWLSTVLENYTGVSYSIGALIIGATLGYFELVPAKLLDKAKATGFFNLAVFASIIPSMAKISVHDLLTLSYNMVIIFAVTLIATYAAFYFLPLWKIVRSKNLAIGITMANMIGFPATFLVANEVANAVARSEVEKEIVLKTIMPAYVIAGFATVTVLSIVIAGIFAKML